MSEHSHLESILDRITGGFFAMDAGFRITYWNKAAEEGTGLSAGDVLGRDVFDVFPNASEAPLGDAYRVAMETKTFQSLETAYRDERFEAWFDVRVYPSADGLSVFFQDVTEKKREQRRKDMLVEVSQVVNTSHALDEMCRRAASTIAARMEVPENLVCMYLYDPRANEIRLVAPASFDLEYPQDIVHQKVRPDAPRIPARAASSREIMVSDHLWEATASALLTDFPSDASVRSLIVLPLTVGGELQGVLEIPSIKEAGYVGSDLEALGVIANDIAIGMSRKRLIDQLRLKNIELEAQTAKTTEASDTLKKFLAMFSHELRSPLNSIIGFSDLLGSKMEELPPVTVQEFMKNIQASGKHLQHILNDILDLSKIEAGQMELHVATYPVSYFSEAVQRVLSAAMREKDIHLYFEFDPDFEEIVVDQTRFKQILINLVSNAIKFSNTSGTIVVRLQRVGNDMHFSVQDFGTGIMPGELPHLFKPFRQVGTGRDRNKDGVGLGLAITRKLVELHGGTIWAASEWGKGTTMSFKIPMVVDPTSERVLQAGMLLDALKTEHNRTSGDKPLALVVEDSPPAAELLRLAIESAGYRVEIARNGSDAVDMAKRLHPNVITLDLVLPGKDGWQVLKELKRHPLCKQIPVVIVSIVDEKKLGFSLGAVDYFVKPVSREDLVRALDRVRIAQPVSATRPSVLVIDDDRSAAELVQVILESEGFRVLTSFDGKSGVECAVREKPDLVILDLMMPEVSGFDVAHQLKQIPATRGIPIIVLTSMEVDQDVQERLGASATALVQKGSFTKNDLLREIAAIEGAPKP